VTTPPPHSRSGSRGSASEFWPPRPHHGFRCAWFVSLLLSRCLLLSQDRPERIPLRRAPVKPVHDGFPPGLCSSAAACRARPNCPILPFHPFLFHRDPEHGRGKGTVSPFRRERRAISRRPCTPLGPVGHWIRETRRSSTTGSESRRKAGKL